MKDRIRLELNNVEKKLIFDSLILMREYLKGEERPTDVIDEILLKIGDSYKVELDSLDARIIIHSLSDMREEMIENDEPRNDINNIILKVISETDKKKLVLRKMKDSGKR